MICGDEVMMDMDNCREQLEERGRASWTNFESQREKNCRSGDLLLDEFGASLLVQLGL